MPTTHTHQQEAPAPATPRPGGRGLTLVEILVAVVVVGILSAIVVAGVSGLTDHGTHPACATSREAVGVAAAVHVTQSGRQADTFDAMLGAGPPTLTLPTGVTRTTPLTIEGDGWILTMAPGTGNAAPAFSCG